MQCDDAYVVKIRVFTLMGYVVHIFIPCLGIWLWKKKKLMKTEHLYYGW